MAQPTFEALLLQALLEEGLVDPADLDSQTSAREEVTTIWGPVVQALMDAGRLDPLVVRRVAATLLGAEQTTTGPAVLEHEAAEAPPPSPIDWRFPEDTSGGTQGGRGRFIDLRLVGVGGAGRVYRAFDLRLERHVALKFLRWELPQERDWLLAEARVQARVKHPHVREVFEVGEMEGEPYILMRWVEGGTLASIAPGLDLGDQARLLRQVCEAVQAAHDQGLLHLDLKPANILVEQATSGWSALVTDFGLGAHHQKGAARKPLMGTPPYSSPEQAMGRVGELDGRSDVYSLGMTLEALLGPRRKGQRGREDLERIAGRAASLVKEDRYPNPAAMAADLARWLEGRPISMRERESRHAFALWCRRHRRAVTAGGLALLTLTAFLAWGIRERWLRKRSAELAGQVGQEANQLENYLALAYLSPPHDLRPQKAEVGRRIEALRSRITGLDPSAQGAGHQAIGQALARLGDAPGALAAFEQAWTLGVRNDRLTRTLGEVRGLRHLRNTWDDSIPAVRDAKRESERMEGEPSRKLLRQYLRSTREGAAPGPEILLAELEGRAEVAWELGGRALLKDEAEPWQYQSWLMLLDLWDHRFQAYLGEGRVDRAREVLDRHRATLARALAVGRSDPELIGRKGFLHLAEAWLHEVEGRSCEADLQAAASAFDAATQLDPDLLWPLRWKADIHRRIGEDLRRRGQDPKATWERGIEIARRGYRRSAGGKESPGLGLFLARLLVTLGLFELEEGRGQGTERLEEAQAILASIQPAIEGLEFRVGWTCLRNIQFHKAERAVELGAEADALLRDLERTLRESRPYRPANEWPGDFANFATLHSIAREATGGDALGPLREAWRVLDAARKDFPDLPRLHVAAARLHLREAEIKAASGAPWHDHAEAGMKLLMEFGRTHPEGLLLLAQAQLLEGRYGRDRARALALARKYLHAARSKGLLTYAVWITQARVELADLRLAPRGGAQSSMGLQRCAEALARAEARSPGSKACAQLKDEAARIRTGAGLP